MYIKLKKILVINNFFYEIKENTEFTLVLLENFNDSDKRMKILMEYCKDNKIPMEFLLLYNHKLEKAISVGFFENASIGLNYIEYNDIIFDFMGCIVIEKLEFAKKNMYVFCNFENNFFKNEYFLLDRIGSICSLLTQTDLVSLQSIAFKNDYSLFNIGDEKIKTLEEFKTIHSKVWLNVLFEEKNKEFYFFFDELKKISSIICDSNFIIKKGKALYLSGASDSGKSLLLEKFLIKIFGFQNVGILDFSSNFSMEELEHKKILLFNEFFYNKKNREILLKILDGSPVLINRKYKKSKTLILPNKVCLISNYSVSDFKKIIYKNDKIHDFKAFENRFQFLFFNKNLKELNINYNNVIKEFEFFIVLLSIAEKSESISNFVENLYVLIKNNELNI